MPKSIARRKTQQHPIYLPIMFLQLRYVCVCECVCAAGSLPWTAVSANVISWWGAMTRLRWPMETTWMRRALLHPTWPPMSGESLYLQVGTFSALLHHNVTHRHWSREQCVTASQWRLKYGQIATLSGQKYVLCLHQPFKILPCLRFVKRETVRRAWKMHLKCPLQTVTWSHFSFGETDVTLHNN